jgi:hypothetical protein
MTSGELVALSFELLQPARAAATSMKEHETVTRVFEAIRMAFSRQETELKSG